MIKNLLKAIAMNKKIQSKIFSLLFLSLFISNEGLAKNKFNEEAVLDSIKKVVAEHKTYATCLSLDATSYQLVLGNWEREVGGGIEALQSYKPSPAFIAKFKSAVAADNLLDRKISLVDAMEYCHKNENQIRKFYEFGYSHLSDAINKAANN